MARGTYHAVVQKEGYGHEMREVVIGDSAPEDLQFKLSPGSGVTIKVVDARDNRAITANAVRIVDSAGQVVTAGGPYTMSGSPERGQPIQATFEDSISRQLNGTSLPLTRMLSRTFCLTGTSTHLL